MTVVDEENPDHAATASARGRPRVAASSRRGASLLVTIVALLFAVACRKPSGATDPIRVAAAADLTDAFTELGQVFEAKTGQSLTFSFGSSGLLAKQIAEGAPFDVFAAANVSFVEQVVAAGACDPKTQASFARGRIVLWTRHGGVAPPEDLRSLSDERFTRIAIANPEHAPYGQAAMEALRDVGVSEAVERRLVYGENVRQTLQFAETGNAEVAIVALALVIHDRRNPWTLIDERHHRPITQALVACDRGGQRTGGAAFAAFVGSAEGRQVMRRYGFVLPGEQLELAR
jgi:molybdate transport system substrate-binding protein